VTPAPASRDQVLRTLRARKADARQQFGVELVGIVGSVARNEARPDSDVDIILHPVERISLFDLVRLRDMLAEGLGRSVDLVISEDMPTERRAYIERDLVPL
jgi:predicted nucleotidyltransferase